MLTNLTKQDLIDFEQDILNEFEAGHIRSPIHLNSGCEQQLIEIFNNVRKQDWTCCSWKSHYEALLKGVPPELIKEKILNNHSISLCFKEYKFISSAIVADICSIALGLAWAAKNQNKDERIYCHIGDMTSASGHFFECWQFSVNYELPTVWVIGDNNRSVCTKTNEAWKYDKHPFYNAEKVIYYQYESTLPHHGGHNFVSF